MSMSTIQEKAFKLLKEFDQICQEHNLDYCLEARTAAQGVIYKGFNDNFIDLQVIMPIEDCLKFISAVETSNCEDRLVEYMGNSKNYSSFSVSYIDKTSTYIDLKRGTDYNIYGVKITIQLIRKNIKASWSAFLELGWENNGYRLTNKLSISRLMALAFVRVLMIIGKKNLAKLLFSRFCNVYKKIDNSAVFIRPFKSKRKVFNKNYFNKKGNITFEGYDFPVPKDLSVYLVTILGPGWRETVINVPVSTSSTILIANVSYQKYLEYLQKTDMPLKYVFKKQRMAFLSGVFAFRHVKSKEKAWDIACRSGDRLKFYEEFQLKREKINNLHLNKAYDELDKLFAEHERKTKYYLNNNLGLCVSEEILDLQCELLINRGERETVEKLRSLIPAEHKKPIKEID